MNRLILTLLAFAITRTPSQTGLDCTAPWPVDRPGLAFDSRRHLTVMFGGGHQHRNRYTWEWDGTRWTRRDITGPPMRTSHGMSYDSRRGRMVLFGGYNDDGLLGDTWEFDGNQWLKVADTGPAKRLGFGMAYDSARGRTVLFGGGGDVGDPEFTDTWEWDGKVWTRSATTGPSGNLFLKMAYDGKRQRVIAFGGRGGGNQTWEWDGKSWSRLAVQGPPTPRDHHAMTYDSRRGAIVVFGGGMQLPNGDFPKDTTGAWLRDLWSSNGTSWTRLAGSGPPSRGGQPGLVYDSVRDRLVLFGGGNLNGTWEWDGTRWTQVDDPPERRLEE